MYLYHYYDKTIGPFNNLSDLSASEDRVVLEQVKRLHPGSQCAQRFIFLKGLTPKASGVILTSVKQRRFGEIQGVFSIFRRINCAHGRNMAHPKVTMQWGIHEKKVPASFFLWENAYARKAF